ncbi:MAG: hypothetical protein F6K56_28110 [Moorea sp. SIO3G5]|nr:hypothetical protein [Moorena sp. SIO3G5]
MIKAAKAVLVNFCLLPLASCLPRSAVLTPRWRNCNDRFQWLIGNIEGIDYEPRFTKARETEAACG